MSTTSLAFGQTKPAAQPVRVAASDPEGGGATREVPSAGVAATPSAKEVLTPTKPPAAGPGFVLDVGSGLGILTGQALDGLDLRGAFLILDLRAGWYLTRHVGVLAGVQGMVGSLSDGCPSCNAYGYQFPVVAQVALEDRSRGLYAEGGLSLFPTLGAAADIEHHPELAPMTLDLKGLFDLKAAIGYRLIYPGPSDKAPTSSADIRLAWISDSTDRWTSVLLLVTSPAISRAGIKPGTSWWGLGSAGTFRREGWGRAGCARCRCEAKGCTG
jgi:hypothetical protein